MPICGGATCSPASFWLIHPFYLLSDLNAIAETFFKMVSP